MKQWLHDFLSHPWVDCKEAADGADGRAECGKRGTSWGSSRYRYRKSATAVRRVTDVPTVLPSSIFNFVPAGLRALSTRIEVQLMHQMVLKTQKCVYATRPDPVTLVTREDVLVAALGDVQARVTQNVTF